MSESFSAFRIAVVSIGLRQIDDRIHAKRRLGALCRRLLLTAICIVAVYFLLCLRLTYFKEWYWDADAKHVYHLVAYYSRKYGIRDVVVNWKWVAALNFYRKAFAGDDINEFKTAFPYPLDRQLYVLDLPLDQPVIDKLRLTVVYKGELSDVAIAFRASLPEREATVGGGDLPADAKVLNLSRRGATDFYVGEAFEVLVSGHPGAAVTVAAGLDGGPSTMAQYGFTDADGRFSFKGTMGREHVGRWREVWSVGPSAAPPIQFQVRARPLLATVP